MPLDLVKCRIQVDPAKYGNIINGFRVTLRESGIRELGKGWAPTFFGYSAQGLCKFGFYEVFKIFYGNLLGEVLTLHTDNLVKFTFYKIFTVTDTKFRPSFG